MRNVPRSRNAQSKSRTEQSDQQPTKEHTLLMRTFYYRSVAKPRGKLTTDSPINVLAPEKTAQGSADHTALPLNDQTFSYTANGDFTNGFFTAQDTHDRSHFVTRFDEQSETPSSQRLRLLSRHVLESPSWLLKIRSKKAGASELQLVNPLPTLSEPILCHNFPPIGSTGCERFPKTLQSHTIAHQPSNKRQNKRPAAKRQSAQSLALAEEFPDKIHKAITKHMRRDACDVTIAWKLDSESSHIKLSTTLSNAFHRTNNKGPVISSVWKNGGKRSTNAASIESTQSQKLFFNDTLLEIKFYIEYVHPTRARQSKKTTESFTLHQDAAAKNSKEHESSVTPYDKTTLSVEAFNTIKQRIETSERLNSFLASSGSLRKEVVRLRKKLNDVLVNAESCNISAPASVETPSTSASRSTDRSTKVTAKVDKTLNQLKKEFLDIKTPLNLCKILTFCFFGQLWSLCSLLRFESTLYQLVWDKNQGTVDTKGNIPAATVCTGLARKMCTKKTLGLDVMLKKNICLWLGLQSYIARPQTRYLIAPLIKFMLPFSPTALSKNLPRESCLHAQSTDFNLLELEALRW